MTDNATESLGGAIADVRALCAVIELGSVSAAARALGETKGSLSRRVSRLEHRLGATLLSRTSRAVSATDEGLAFYVKAHDALVLLDDATEGARQSRAVPHGQLRVTAPHDIALDVLPVLITRFRALHPQITVELVVTDALLDLAANRIDLALRAMAGPLPDTGYRASQLVAFRVRCYAAPAYAATRGLPATIDELAMHDLVAVGGVRNVARLTLSSGRGRAVEVPIRPVIVASDFACGSRLVLAGAGIGPVPDIVAAAAVADGRLVPVLPAWSSEDARLYAMTVAGRDAPARVRVFREFLRTELERMIAE